MNALSQITRQIGTTNKSLATFRASIRAAVRGIFSGDIDALSGADALFSAIRRGYNQAWAEGAKQCGILENERTEEETKQLELMIGDNFQYVGAFVEWLIRLRADGGSLDSAFTRSNLWINRYDEVKAKAQSMACGDKKLRWVINGGEHCRSCLKLNGRVARASAWNSRDVYPRMVGDKLHCKGYNCKCSFIETDEPVTKGRWPNLP